MQHASRFEGVRLLRDVAAVGLTLAGFFAASSAVAVVPGPVQNVRWCAGAKDCLQWSPTAGATQYRIYRGERASLPCLLAAPVDSCLESIVVPAATGAGAIPEIPAPGRFYWFLVTAESASGEGPSGKSRIGVTTPPRFRDTFGSCPASCTASGGACLGANDCCSSSCSGVCDTACCAPAGALCAGPGDCCSSNCVGSVCQPCLALGQSCATPASCCTGNCASGTCVPSCLPDGDACTLDNQCCGVSVCSAGSCQPCVPTGGTCATAGQCCTGLCSGSVCIGTCGDGVIHGNEQCDDNNTLPGDGCSANCMGEPGFSCSGSPSVCTPCPSGFSNCNGISGDGCEVSVSSDPANCGACGNVCVLPNATSTCVGGVCQIGSCDPNYGDCNNNPADGCEVYLGADPANCGGCGTVCSIPNATSTCVGGSCQIASCNPNYGNCNGNPVDGCEVFLGADPSHCGGCGNVCALPNATSTCVGGSCQIGSCNPNYGNCNGNPVDGCEVFLGADPNHCGGCGNVCALPNATSTCSGGSCQIGSCSPNYGNCNGNPVDGCEVFLGADPNHCGGCGNVCSLPNATSTCSGGSCQVASCNAGFGNCDGVPANGCEVNTNSNGNHCGGCGNVCPPETFCTGGTCFAP